MCVCVCVVLREEEGVGRVLATDPPPPSFFLLPPCTGRGRATATDRSILSLPPPASSSSFLLFLLSSAAVVRMLQLRQLRFYFQFGRVHPNNVWGRKVAVAEQEVKGERERENEGGRLEIATQGYAMAMAMWHVEKEES